MHNPFLRQIVFNAVLICAGDTFRVMAMRNAVAEFIAAQLEIPRRIYASIDVVSSTGKSYLIDIATSSARMSHISNIDILFYTLTYLDSISRCVTSPET